MGMGPVRHHASSSALEVWKAKSGRSQAVNKGYIRTEKCRHKSHYVDEAVMHKGECMWCIR